MPVINQPEMPSEIFKWPQPSNARAGEEQEQESEFDSDKFSLKDIRFKNQLQDIIELKDVRKGFEKNIVFEEIGYQLKISLFNESLVFDIEWGPIGTPCTCCSGSGRQKQNEIEKLSTDAD